MALRYDYGTDLSCTDDLSPDAVEVSGLTNLSQALYRRLITARGGIVDDPSYGFDANSMIDAEASRREIAMLSSRIDGELIKDERVLTSSTVGEYSRATRAFVATTTIATADGPFKMVLAISDVSVELLQPLR